MTRPARFTISEVAVDWQETVVLQRKLRPSNCTRYNLELNPRYAASKHTTAPITAPGLHPVSIHTSTSTYLYCPCEEADIRLQLTTQFIDLERMKG